MRTLSHCDSTKYCSLIEIFPLSVLALSPIVSSTLYLMASLCSIFFIFMHFISVIRYYIFLMCRLFSFYIFLTTLGVFLVYLFINFRFHNFCSSWPFLICPGPWGFFFFFSSPSCSVVQRWIQLGPSIHHDMDIDKSNTPPQPSSAIIHVFFPSVWEIWKSGEGVADLGKLPSIIYNHVARKWNEALLAVI